MEFENVNQRFLQQATMLLTVPSTDAHKTNICTDHWHLFRPNVTTESIDFRFNSSKVVSITSLFHRNMHYLNESLRVNNDSLLASMKNNFLRKIPIL